MAAHGDRERHDDVPIFLQPEEIMTAPPAALSSDVTKAHQELHSPDLGPANKRERLLRRVLDARKRLPQTPRAPLARIR
jgi:hypothetical protein